MIVDEILQENTNLEQIIKKLSTDKNFIYDLNTEIAAFDLESSTRQDAVAWNFTRLQQVLQQAIVNLMISSTELFWKKAFECALWELLEFMHVYIAIYQTEVVIIIGESIKLLKEKYEKKEDAFDIDEILLNYKKDGLVDGLLLFGLYTNDELRLFVRLLVDLKHEKDLKFTCKPWWLIYFTRTQIMSIDMNVRSIWFRDLLMGDKICLNSLFSSPPDYVNKFIDFLSPSLSLLSDELIKMMFDHIQHSKDDDESPRTFIDKLIENIASSKVLLQTVLPFVLEKDLQLMKQCFTMRENTFPSGKTVQIYDNFYLKLCNKAGKDSQLLGVALKSSAIKFIDMRMTSYPGENEDEAVVKQFAKGTRLFFVKFLGKLFDCLHECSDGNLTVELKRNASVIRMILKMCSCPDDGSREQTLRALNKLGGFRVVENLDFDMLFTTCNQISKELLVHSEKSSVWSHGVYVYNGAVMEAIAKAMSQPSIVDLIEETEMEILKVFMKSIGHSVRFMLINSTLTCSYEYMLKYMRALELTFNNHKLSSQASSICCVAIAEILLTIDQVKKFPPLKQSFGRLLVNVLKSMDSRQEISLSTKASTLVQQCIRNKLIETSDISGLKLIGDSIVSVFKIPNYDDILREFPEEKVQKSAMSKLKDMHKRALPPPLHKNSNNKSTLSNDNNNISAKRIRRKSETDDSDDQGNDVMSRLIRETPINDFTNISMSVRPKEYTGEQRLVKFIDEPINRSVIPVRLVHQRPKSQQEQMAIAMRDSLDKFHNHLLSWDMWNLENKNDEYEIVGNKVTFENGNDYVKAFEPVVLLECKAALSRDFEAARNSSTRLLLTLDSCSHSNGISKCVFTCRFKDSRFALDLSDVDLLFLCKSTSTVQTKDYFSQQLLLQQDNQSYCLAKILQVQSIVRERSVGVVTVKIKTQSRPDLIRIMMSGTQWEGLKITHLSTTEREFQAIHCIQYYNLSSNILQPHLHQSERSKSTNCSTIKIEKNLNESQKQSVQSVLNTLKGFCLIQGPPGTGKTTVIEGIVKSILRPLKGNQVSIGVDTKVTEKHLLVCAPSNAAIDELVRRLRRENLLKIVRIGTLEGVHASVRDCTLEQLVENKLFSDGQYSSIINAELGVNTVYEIRKSLEEVRKKIMQQYSLLDTRKPNNVDGDGDDDDDDDDESVSFYLSVEQELEKLIDLQNELRNKLNSKLSTKDKSKRELDAIRTRLKREIINDANVILSTLSMSAHESLTLNLLNGFHTIIIDEACQSTEISCLIPLRHGAQRCVLVGDPNQLPPTLLSQQAQKLSHQSLFTRLQQAYSRGNDDENNKVLMLRTQYRMHPEISQFPNQEFYQTQLIDGPNLYKLRDRPWHKVKYFRPFQFFDVHRGRESTYKKSAFNQHEVDFVLHLYSRLKQSFPEYNFKGKIGVITPYKEQKRRLMKAFSERSKEDVEINTVDGFQGQEKDIIIFTCVRANNENSIGFLSDVRRLNVAITRAKSSLWIVGNAKMLSGSNGVWRRLVRNAGERNLLMDV